MKISIIMASYNYANIIEEAIESVINQTYTNWELIIIDDCSEDNSVEIIKKYLSDTRIKLLVNDKNVGLAKTLQKGIKQASSEWIAFLESDDKFLPNALEEKVKAISTGADIIFSGLEPIGEEKNIHLFQQYFSDINEKFIDYSTSGFVENFPKILPNINPIPTFSVAMLKKELLQECKFTSVCKSSLDYYLWAQLSSYCKVYYIAKKLTYWRLHSDSYIYRNKYSWLRKYLFIVIIYANTIKNKNIFLRVLLILNNMRARLIYLKWDKNSIKLNLAYSNFIIEKKFNK